MVGFIRCLNNLLLLPVPLFCLRFLSPKIHNYSSYVLNNSERFLLSLGLNFRPTPRILSNHLLCEQFDDFVRSVRTKHFFRDFTCINSHPHQYSKLCVKSEWTPPRFLSAARILIPFTEQSLHKTEKSERDKFEEKLGFR